MPTSIDLRKARGLGKYHVQLVTGSGKYEQKAWIGVPHTYQSRAVEYAKEAVAQKQEQFPGMPVRADIFIKVREVDSD